MQKMADTQAMTQAMIQATIEVAKAAVQTMAVARAEAGSRIRSETVSAGPKLGGPSLPTAIIQFESQGQMCRA